MFARLVGICFVMVVAACSEATFQRSTQKAEKAQDGDQAPQDPAGSSISLEYDVIAGSIASVQLADIGRDGTKKFVDLDKSLLPADVHIDTDNGRIAWQTDWQDIGASFQSVASVLIDGVQSDLSFKVNVLPPKFEGGTCDVVIPPVIGDVQPAQVWHWPGIGKYSVTYSSPVAGDLDGDGQVEIVTIASTTDYWLGNGPLVVLNGATGEVLWNSLDAGIGAQVSTTPSLADLDGDGYAEIIVVSAPATGLEILVVSYKTKSVLARYASSDFICGDYCNTAVGDIDGDGSPEIVAGNTVLNANGTKKFILNPAPVAALTTELKAPTIADLVPTSPGDEIVISGSQVYSSTGSLLWAGSCLGFSAVADLEKDGKADLVCIGSGEVHRYTDRGVLAWKRDIPTNGNKSRGGAPNVGDFNGDGLFEIGTAGGEYYVVFDKDGNELWKRKTQDASSQATGSSLFDFNGDGKVEVVYNDELSLMIYDGTTGNLLFSTPNPSGTLWEYPLILNVDSDPSVEIVVSSPGMGGVRMFKDPTKLWVGSRRLWNQYSYMPESVDDKLRIKAKPGITQTGFRVNTPGKLGKGHRKQLADIQAKAPVLFDRGLGGIDAGSPKLTLLVLNGGEVAPSEDVPVDIMLPGQAQPIAETLLKAADLAPGKFVLVKLDIPAEHLAAVQAGATLRLNLDKDNKPKAQECKVDNNKAEVKPVVL